MVSENSKDDNVPSPPKGDYPSLVWYVAADDFIKFSLAQQGFQWNQAPSRSEEFDKFCDAVRKCAIEGPSEGDADIKNISKSVRLDNSPTWYKNNLGIGGKIFEKDISWESIVSLYRLGGAIIQRVFHENHSTELYALTSFWIGQCIEEYALIWIENNGGSDGFIRFAEQNENLQMEKEVMEETRLMRDYSDGIPQSSEIEGLDSSADESLANLHEIAAFNLKSTETEELLSGDEFDSPGCSKDSDRLHIGDYEVNVGSDTAVLGEGKFGVVYRGKNTRTGVDVAMKKLPNDSLEEKELELVKKLQNPSIVKYFGIEKGDAGFSFIVMELCDMDLAVFLEKHKSLSGSNLNLLGRSLAEGYLSLHDHSVVHRDIKPQNLLIKVQPQGIGRSGTGNEPLKRRESTAGRKLSSAFRKFSRSISATFSAGHDPTEHLSDGQPTLLAIKLTDFGCSRQLQNQGDDFSNLAGTFYYMAPEVGANLVEESFYDSKVDMWSIGVVLYEAAVGEYPYQEKDLCKLFLKAATGSTEGFEPRVPNSVLGSNGRSEKAAPKLMQLDPDQRMTPEAFHAFIMGGDTDEDEIKSPQKTVSLSKVRKFFKSNTDSDASESAAQKNARLRKERLEGYKTNGTKTKCCPPSSFLNRLCCCNQKF